MKSSYNERFLHDNPSDHRAISRSTRYRAKKKRLSSVPDEANSTAEVDMNSVTQLCRGPLLDTNLAEPNQRENQSTEAADMNSREDEDLDEMTLETEDVNPLTIEAEIIVPPTDEYTDEFQEDSHVFNNETAPTYIYEGSSLTISSSCVLMMKYKMRHNLTEEALADLLKLVKIHCPLPNLCVSSVYHFKKQFGDLQYPIVFHYFCSKCSVALDDSGGVHRPPTCPNSLCDNDLNADNSVSSFIEIPIDLQLKTILERDGIMYTIFFNCHRRHTQGSMYSDVYDGKVYQDAVANGFLSDQRNISFIFNTDGIPVFRSSGFSFWPLYLLINELPYHMRIAKENRILAGLWYGSTKPEMTLFLKPMVQSLTRLHSEGLTIAPPPTFNSFTCRATLICTTCDLPAKAIVLNCTQFNGFYGCSHCLQKGKTFRIGERSSTHVYPYNEDDPCGPLRKHITTCQQMEKAASTGSPVFGVKGPSWLSVIPDYDLINGLSVDYMHCVLLGVCRRLLRLWIQSQYHSDLWYIGDKVDILDERLCGIKPPNEIQRTPRSVSLTLQFWKAHELRAWLLHYSTAVLEGILPDVFYEHHLLLVDAIYLLLKEIITDDDVSRSMRLLQHYCFLFATLYGERNMTINVHSLLHLPHVVRCLGPLWAHSCFSFEAANGDILHFFHGSQSVEKQVINHISTLQKLPSLAETILPSGSQQHGMFIEMNQSKRHLREEKDSCEGNTVIGKPHNASLSNVEVALLRMKGCSVTSIDITDYPSLRLSNNSVITARSRSRSTKRDNSCLQYFDDGLQWGILERIFTFSGTTIIYCTILILQPLLKQPGSDQVTNVKLEEHLMAFHPPCYDKMLVTTSDKIVKKCVYMDLYFQVGCVYASLFPNTIELD